MKKNKGFLTFLGFGLILVGFLSIILSLVGLRFLFLAWMDLAGPLFSFVIKLGLVLSGFTLVYYAQTDFTGEE